MNNAVEAAVAAEIPAPDPIAALTEINEATAAYNESIANLRVAGTRAEHARKKLDEVQKQFDALYRQLRSAAPDGTYWDGQDDPR